MTKGDLRKVIGKNIGIVYLNYFGLPKIASGYLKIEKDFIFLYDLGKSGAGYNFALFIRSKHDFEKILRMEVLADQVYEEIILPNGLRTKILQKPNFS
jgi:hypothetical protein